MTETTREEAMERILNHLPGVPWASRIELSTQKVEWLYMGPQLAEFFGVSAEELRSDNQAMIKRIEPEDAARLREKLTASLGTLATVIWTGRVIRASGERRWIDVQMALERDGDGAIRIYGLAYDVTERERTTQLHRAVIDALPAGVIAMTPEGQFPIYNRTAAHYVGQATTELSDQGYGVFRTDGVTLYPEHELPLQRVLAGEDAPDAEMILRNGQIEGDCWVHGTGTALRDEDGKLLAAVVIFHDITARHELEQELRTRNAQLAESEEGKTVLIERLRHAVDELTNPILEVWDDVLVMPIIGVVDSRRTADMVQRLLVEVARTQASFVIVDLTGVEIVDTRTADHLIKLIRKVELVGARCVLTGIRPAVSETLVDIGVDFGRITTLRNLKHGLREALRTGRGEREGRSHGRGDDDDVGDALRPETRARRPAR